MYQTDNEVIGYVNGKAIILDDNGNYFYVVMPEDLVTIGETILEDDLTSLDFLPALEQNEIMNFLTSEV